MAAESTKGRLSDALRRLLMRRATVSACEQVAGLFRLITLEGPALRGVTWTPGQKIQIAMTEPFVTRTYTPIDWDASAGRTRMLCYVHADGPGSMWARSAKPGDTCDIFGPRSSIDMNSATGSLAVFGDETSIGLACALASQRSPQSVACHFELNEIEAGRGAAAHLGLSNSALFARPEDDAHLAQMEAALASPALVGASFVLTGNAQTVQRLRQHLKNLKVSSSRIATKVYWAPGKSGLD